MSIRPIDMQINIGRENDIKSNRVHDELQEEGAQRYTNELQKEHQLKSENIQELDKSELEKLKEENKKKKGKKEKEKEKKKKKEEDNFTDPTKGSIIDIRLS